jgi:cadmium resistance protein CadD (predicted permease)
MEIMPLIAVVMLVGSGFVATNLDNLLLLVLLQTSTQRSLPVLLGFMAASAIVLLIASIGLLLGSLLDPALAGYAGVIPLGLGCYALWHRRQLKSSTASDQPDRSEQGAASVFFGSLALMLSNSGDSLAIFLPLLADTSAHLLPAVATSWLLVTLLWVWLALRIGENQHLAAAIERQGSRWLPWIMIAIGSYILLDTVTDSL